MSLRAPTFGGAPELGWRAVTVATADYSQTTGLAALPTDETGGEIRAIVNSGLNIAGEAISGGVLAWLLTDTRGRSVGAGTAGILEVRYTAVSTPLAGGNVQVGVGMCAAANMAALLATPRYVYTSIDYAATRRGTYAYRTGALTAAALAGATLTRAVAGINSIDKAAQNLGYFTAYTAAGSTVLNGGAVGLVTPLVGSGALRLMAYFGSASGAVSGTVGDRTVGGKFEYRFIRLEDMV